jgi:carbon-monoxide dehydrogenase small subunit
VSHGERRDDGGGARSEGEAAGDGEGALSEGETPGGGGGAARQDGGAASDRAGIVFTVNGRAVAVRARPMERLLDVLRGELGLTGTKEGCGEGECGACAVLVDGELVNSCLVPVLQAAGTEVTTIEGVAREGTLHPLQEAFVSSGGAQCGICTPGMIVASLHLLARHPAPTPEQIREGLAGNLCRCTGYTRIFEAVAAAAAQAGGEE